jgi:hypothetical protein
MAEALVDYRLLVYVRLWDLLLASGTNTAALKPLNRVRFDTSKGANKLVQVKSDPASFPKARIDLGSGTDEGWPERYAAGYDVGVIVPVTQDYIVTLTFDKPEILIASPLIAEARASILRGGPRLGGASAGFGYVRRAGASVSTNTVGPDEVTGGTNRLVSTFTVSVAMNLTIGQLCGIP